MKVLEEIKVSVYENVYSKKPQVMSFLEVIIMCFIRSMLLSKRYSPVPCRRRPCRSTEVEKTNSPASLRQDIRRSTCHQKLPPPQPYCRARLRSCKRSSSSHPTLCGRSSHGSGHRKSYRRSESFRLCGRYRKPPS